MYFGTQKAAMRAYAPEVVKKEGEFWVGKLSIKQPLLQKTKPRIFRSSAVQKDLPYLVKGKFVPLENEKIDLSRYVHEDEPDSVLRNFKQSKDNYTVHRLTKNEPITRKNPFAGVQKIKICNSFQMSQKAMN